MSDRLAHGKIELMPVQLHFKQVFKHGPGRRGAPLCQNAGQVGQSIRVVLAQLCNAPSGIEEWLTMRRQDMGLLTDDLVDVRERAQEFG